MARGRQKIAGSGRAARRYLRVSLTNGEKLHRVAYYEEYGADATLNKFYAHLEGKKRESTRKLLYAWVAKKETIALGRSVDRKNRPKGTATTLSALLECELVTWINALRDEGTLLLHSLLC